MEIAVIGIAGRFPLANNMDELLEVLTSGVDGVRSIELDRLSKTTVPTDREYVEMAYLNDIDLFDYKYFNYPKAEANKMAPQHRLALQTVHHALEDTGYPLSAYDGSKTSVYCGAPAINYDEHWETELDPTGIMGASRAFISGRISRIFNLRGNSVTIDTTCSSSLVALHTAVNDLKCGDSDAAVVVGVNIEDFPIERKTHISNEELGVNILSSTHRAKTFSDQADGTGIGEAVVAIVIKPLEKAIEDGDRIHAVIKSTAVNQDAGLSASLTAPDSQAQSEVIREAWKKANINPEDVGYIEAHGTGTKLGDPIEIEGLSIAFKAFTDQKQFCSVSSIKSNFGHTDSAAGLVGLAKVVLSLKHRLKFKSVHFENPNPFIDFENSPVYVQTKTEEWKSKNGKFIAGVSAFGLTGTNCHVVLEAYEDKKQLQNEETKSYLIPISGKNEEALQRNLVALKSYLDQHSDLRIKDVAKTLCKGRNHDPVRAVFLANSLQDISSQLENSVPSNTKAVEKVILVFSDQQLKQTELEILLEKSVVLNHEFDSLCTKHQVEWKKLSEKENMVLLQVATFNALKQAGVRSEFLLGDGLGKLSIRFIKGEATLKEVIEQANHVRAEKENFSERIQRFVEGQTKDTSVGFFETGLLGSISKEINKQIGNFQLAVTNLEDGFFGLLRQAFLLGIDLDWNLWLKGDEKTVSLPGYVFEPSRCWLKEPYPIEENIEWQDSVKFHTSKWIEVTRNELSNTTSENVLVALSNPEHKPHFENWFSGHDLTFVSLGEGDADNGILGLTALKEGRSKTFSLFIDTVNFFQSESDPSKVFFEQLSWLKAVKELTSTDSIKYVFLATDGFDVENGDSVNPTKYASLAFAKSVQADIPKWNVLCIDFKSTDNLAEIDIVKEIRKETGKAIIAYRNGESFEQEFETRDFSELDTHKYTDGDYVITGGASGIGAVLAGEIAQQIDTGRIYILGRSGENDRLEILDELRKINPKVAIKYNSLDVSSEKEMELYGKELKNEGVSKLQALIHAAGVGMGNTLLFEESEASFNEVMGPKLEGLLNLIKTTAFLTPEKTILFSSLNAVLPYPKSGSYAVGNAFMDGYALSSKNVLSVGWTGWQGIGMSKHSNETEFLLTEKEFLAVFTRALSIASGHVLITKGEIAQFAHNPYVHISGVEGETAHEEDNLPIREYIYNLWVKILEEPNIGWDEDFFDLGGHSLIGAQMVNILKGKYQVDLEFEDIYEYATINHLAAFIEANGTVDGVDEEEETQHDLKRYPLTAAQEGIWVVSQMEERRSDFNMAGLIELRGELDFIALKKAVHLVTEKHETLRSVFSQTEEGLFQEVLEMNQIPEKPELIKTDFTNLEKAIEYVKEEARNYSFAPFNLNTEVPLRIRLYSNEKEHHILVFVTHHIVSDGVSLDLFTEELFKNYYAVIVNPNYQPEKLKETFRGHVSAQLAYFKSEDYQNDKSFWENELHGKIPRLKLPNDVGNENPKSKVGGTLEFSFSEEDRQALERLRKSLKISPFLLYTALVKLLMFKYHGADFITVGIPYFGRDDEASQKQIGLFVNLLPLHTRLEENMTFTDLVIALKESYFNALKHKRYPFEHMIKGINSGEKKFEDTIFDVSVNYWEDQKKLYTAADYVDVGGGLERRIHTFDETVIQDDIAFEFSGGSSNKGLIKYNKNRFKHITIELMAERLLQLVKNAETNLNKPIMNIDFNPAWVKEQNLVQSFQENLNENF